MSSGADPIASPRPGHRGRAENEALAGRLGVLALSLEVQRCEALTASCRRLGLVGDDLAELRPLPGQDLMISLETLGDRVLRRRYTIRRFDPEERVLDLDIALHGDGPGMRWAAAAEPGHRVEALGPRGKVTLDPDAAWHLFFGDDSFAPAALNMAEAVPDDQTVLLAIEIDGPDHEQPSEIRAAVAGPRWVMRDGVPGGDPDPLLTALARTELPSGRGHAYIGGEHAVVGALRDALIERGVDPDAINAKSYWRLGRQNAANGEPERA
jgi:NADPH-dependent ferric siderophore reductase